MTEREQIDFLLEQNAQAARRIEELTAQKEKMRQLLFSPENPKGMHGCLEFDGLDVDCDSPEFTYCDCYEKAWKMAEELKWLRYFYNQVDLGPGQDDVVHCIATDFMADEGCDMPEGYENA